MTRILMFVTMSMQPSIVTLSVDRLLKVGSEWKYCQ